MPNEARVTSHFSITRAHELVHGLSHELARSPREAHAFSMHGKINQQSENQADLRCANSTWAVAKAIHVLISELRGY